MIHEVLFVRDANVPSTSTQRGTFPWDKFASWDLGIWVSQSCLTVCGENCLESLQCTYYTIRVLYSDRSSWRPRCGEGGQHEIIWRDVQSKYLVPSLLAIQEITWAWGHFLEYSGFLGNTGTSMANIHRNNYMNMDKIYTYISTSCGTLWPGIVTIIINYINLSSPIASCSIIKICDLFALPQKKIYIF